MTVSRRYTVAALALIGCLAADCPPDEPDEPGPAYVLDGVPVHVDGAGPSEAAMILAVELYRRDVLELLELEPDDEAELWASLDRIVWTADAVPGGGTYDDGRLRLEYAGCALEGPLYRLLVTHYRLIYDGRPEPPAEDLAWAEELTAAHAPAVCSL